MTEQNAAEPADEQAVVLSHPRRGGKTMRLIEQFNDLVPVGSPVLFWPGEREGQGRQSVTRSEAWLLGGHTAVVMVEGYAGGIALSHVMGPPCTRPGEGRTSD